MPVILGLVGAILAFVGMAMPWVSISSSNPLVAAMASALPLTGFAFLQAGVFEAVLVLLGAILAIVGILLKKPPMAMLAMVGGVLILLGAVIAMGEVAKVQAMLTAFGGATGITIGMGLGLILCLVAGLLAIVGGLLRFKELKKQAMPMAPGAPM